MRKLLLLRHAKASSDDPSLGDFDRPLTGRGRRNARQMAKFLEHTAPRPQMVLVSTARRARTTWDIIEPRLPGVPVSYEDALYEAGRASLLDRVHRLDGHLSTVMMLGHNPGLERLALALSGGHGEPSALALLKEKFPTGALAVLETTAAHWAELGPSTCRLTLLVRPKDLGEE